MKVIGYVISGSKENLHKELEMELDYFPVMGDFLNYNWVAYEVVGRYISYVTKKEYTKRNVTVSIPASVKYVLEVKEIMYEV